MAFRYGLRISIAVLTLVLLHSLVAPSPACGFDWDPHSYFEIDYDVSFSDDEVDIGEAFDLVIWGHAECIKYLPFGLDAARGVADFVARHKETGRTEMLRARYSASIGPDPEFPDWEGDEYTVDERVTLTFPEGSSYGDYEVIAQLVQAQVSHTLPEWEDVTVPESYHSVVVGEISCVPYTPLDTDFSADSGVAGHPLEGIAGATEFRFTDESSGGTGPYSYEWDFDSDGTIDSTQANPCWIYDDANTYTVALTVTDSSSPPLSGTETKTDYIAVHEPLDTDFSADSGVAGHPLEGIAGATEFQFTNESVGGIPPYSYGWDFNNDGTIDSTEENPSWSYDGADTYTVALTVSDIVPEASSDTETKVGYITVYAHMEADFSANSGIAGHALEGIAGGTEFQFTDETSGGTAPYTSWAWDFGDGMGTSMLEKPSYTYPDAGTYTIALTVTDSDIIYDSDTETKVGYITVYGPLEAALSADSGIVGHPTEGYAGVTDFGFINESVGGIPPYSYEWDFNNDGIIDSTLENPSYTYPDAGTYTIALTVTDSDIIYDSDTETKVGYITVYAPLGADLSADSGIVGHPTEGYVGVTDFGFFNESVGGIPPYSYEWDFNNDGTIDSTLENPSYTYSDTGIYTVALTVTDSSPASEIATKVGYITVHAPVEADFYADSGISGHPLEGIVGGTEFQFTDESSGGIGSYSYEWDFNNDGIIDSTEENPSWIYDDADTYTVVLTVTDSSSPPLSGTETKTDYIIVYEALEADFSANSGIPGHPLEGIAGGTEFQFTNESVGGIPPYSYEWDFNNDGIIDSTLENPSYTYADAATYTVALTVSDIVPGASSDTGTKVGYIMVYTPLEVDFSADSRVTGHPTEGYTGVTEFDFANESVCGTPAYGYEWNFDNDGIIDSTEENPKWVYGESGIYTVSLTVTDSSSTMGRETKIDYIRVYEAGDANANGVVDMCDVTKVERIILELDTATLWADANQDSIINMADVTKIERIILGIDC